MHGLYAKERRRSTNRLASALVVGQARRVRSGRVRIPFRIPSAAGRSFDVVGFGLNSIDILNVVAEYPASGSKQRLQRFARLPGGEIATAMVTCARLGFSARYIGSFGGDELGALSRASMLAEGVDISAARVVGTATNQFAVILVDARSGEQTVLWDRHPALTMGPADVPRGAIVSGRILIVDCHETAAAAQAAAYAREAGIPTIADVHRVRPGIGDLLRHIDAIIASHEFPTALTGHDEPGRALAALAREFDAPVVCMTLGSDGTLTRCLGHEIRTPGFPIDCVDGTGAGDAFRGAFAAGCLRAPDGTIEEILSYANAVAALNCRALGAQAALPRPDEVEQLLTGIRPGL
jgi:sulfofructose kinase